MRQNAVLRGNGLIKRWKFYLNLKKPLKHIVEKKKNVGNQHFPLFPQCFIPYQRQSSSF